MALVDTSSIMGFQPNNTNYFGAFQGAQNNALKLMQAKREQQSQNALRQLYANPQNLDPSGGLNQNALRQIMAIDPQTGFQVQEEQQKVQSAQLKRVNDIQGMIDPVRDSALGAYDSVIQKGGSVETANMAGQSALDEGLGEVRQGGTLSDQEKSQLASKFNYEQMKGRSLDYKTRVTLDRQQAMETERERHDERMEGLATKRLETAMAGGNDPKKQIFADWKAQHPNASPQEAGQFLQSLATPRSASAMTTMKFLQENPDAGPGDLASFANAAKEQQNFTSNPSPNAPATKLRTLNNAMGHMATYEDAIQDLENGNYPAINKLAATAGFQLGSGKKAAVDFIKARLSDEVTSYFVAGGGTGSERDTALKGQLDEASSPAALKSVAKAFYDLVGQQTSGFKTQWDNATTVMGKPQFGDFNQFLQQKTLDKLKENGLDIDRMSASAGKAPSDAGYQSLDDVKKAYLAGRLSKEEAVRFTKRFGHE
jgi:hypothetical protein